MRNIMWEYVFFLLILVVSAVGWDEVHKSPFFYLTFAIGFFYYGFSFIDYVNERRRLDIDQSIHFIRNHRGLAVAIGSIYSVFILVPVRSEEHTSELQSRPHLVCRLLLEKKKKKKQA